MKKILVKVLLVLSVLTIPILVSAQSYNYEDAINRTNAYILEFPDYNDYIKLDNMPYNFENGQNKQSLRFQKGGFLSKDEYQITNVYGSSYLSQGIEYWTLTPQSFNKNYTITYVLSEKLLEEQTNVKTTSFVKNETKVAGSGTQNDPWYFVDVVSVNVYSSDVNRGTLSLKNCAQKSEGTKTIVVNKYGESDAIFYVCEDRFFRYYKTTCTTNIQKESNSNIAYIKGEINDNTICKIDFAHKTYTVNLGTCSGCSGATPNTIYLAYDRSDYFTDQYGENKFEKLSVVPKKTGYTFGGYKVGDTFIIESDGELPDVTEAARNINTSLLNTAIQPIMTPNKYTVSFDANGGGTPTQTSKSVTYDSTYGTLPTVSREGYTFAGWYTASSGGNKVTSSTTVKITAAQTLYAHWTANSYTVSFDANSGNTPNPTSKQVTYDSTYGDLATSTKTGYTFDGWYTASNGGDKIVSSTKVTKANNQTLYAHWTVNNYTVTFNANGGNTPSKTSKQVTYNSTYGELATVTRTGYDFAGWYTQASGGNQISATSSVNITTAQTLYAHWTPKTYNVTFNLNGGNTVSQSSKTVTYDSNYGSLPTATRTGYTLEGWYTQASGGTKIDTSTKVAITANQTLYAHWTAKTYTVTFNANGGNTPSPASKSVTYDSTYGTLATATRTGYTFAGWYTASSGGTKIETSTKVAITSGQTLYAHWTAKTYTVTFNANGGNTPSPANKSVTYDSTYGTLATTSRSGYTFQGWYTASSGGTKITASSTVSITANQTLYAQWKQNFDLLNSYSCSNTSKGSAPYSMTYTGRCTVINDGSGNWRVKFLSSGTLTFSAAQTIDAFLVGGGGAGGRGSNIFGGGGGGGGYTKTKKAFSYTSGSLTIGAGSTSGSGGTTSGFGTSASGGAVGADGETGGAGGSGGGAGGGVSGEGGWFYVNGDDGGQNGSSGYTGWASSDTAGKGQGSSTREFGSSSGTLYSGGGGGGGGRWHDNYTGAGSGGSGGGASGAEWDDCGYDASANTGGGGGGSGSPRCEEWEGCEYYGKGSCRGYGGSGIIVIRNKR